MSTSRYTRTLKLALGTQLGTSRAIEVIRTGIALGKIGIQDEIVLRGSERLDTIAGSVYGDAGYWWVLAAASDIGWGLQLPPGTVIRVPSLSDVLGYVG